tara:strand:+ start:99 stop:353 length:255 start_codon:yes stop_codon:yes gene_type:complete
MASCECCNIEEETKVFSTPFSAYSVRLCNTCITEDLYPHWLLVSAVDMAGGYDSCDEWFKEIINKNLEHRNMTLEEFNKETFDA